MTNSAKSNMSETQIKLYTDAGFDSVVTIGVHSSHLLSFEHGISLALAVEAINSEFIKVSMCWHSNDPDHQVQSKESFHEINYSDIPEDKQPVLYAYKVACSEISEFLKKNKIPLAEDCGYCKG